jgi:hypothetical protein
MIIIIKIVVWAEFKARATGNVMIIFYSEKGPKKNLCEFT